MGRIAASLRAEQPPAAGSLFRNVRRSLESVVGERAVPILHATAARGSMEGYDVLIVDDDPVRAESRPRTSAGEGGGTGGAGPGACAHRNAASSPCQAAGTILNTSAGECIRINKAPYRDRLSELYSSHVGVGR